MRYRRQAGPLGQFALGAALALIGASTLVFMAVPRYQKASESSDWPSTAGTVVQSEVAESELASGKRNRRRKRSFSPLVVVEYEHGGRTLRTSHISAGADTSSTNPSRANEVVNRYAAGDTVSVYFDPEQPSYAVLEPGVTTTHYVFLAASAGFLGLGLLVALRPLLALLR